MLEPSPLESRRRKRTRRDPKPRFKQDISNQLDITGCAEAMVPKGHLARVVLAHVAALDLSSVEAKYSSLGRHGFHPRCKLAVLIYGSFVGLHESTKLAHALKTDAALRLLSGGHAISAGNLREFRRKNGPLFETANQQILQLAAKAGLIKADELAVDSVRLRAHASVQAARTVERSTKRLQELKSQDTGSLSEEARSLIEEKVRKHEHALAECARTGRTNIVTTSPSAGLLKFPSGASAPGHRMTAVGAGVTERMIIDFIIDADGNDFGKLEDAARRARAVLKTLGVVADKLQITADTGYASEKDLAFAESNQDWADVLVPTRQRGRSALFDSTAFNLNEDGTATCPAGTPMEGPFKDGTAKRFHGVGCSSCPLKPKCTKGKRRYFTFEPEHERLRAWMDTRMADPTMKPRYNKRIATIEPIFSSIEDGMKFRRVTSRNEASVRAEIALKVLAHNISRLAARAPRLLRVRAWVQFHAPYGRIELGCA